MPTANLYAKDCTPSYFAARLNRPLSFLCRFYVVFSMLTMKRTFVSSPPQHKKIARSECHSKASLPAMQFDKNICIVHRMA